RLRDGWKFGAFHVERGFHFGVERRLSEAVGAHPERPVVNAVRHLAGRRVCGRVVDRVGLVCGDPEHGQERYMPFGFAAHAYRCVGALPANDAAAHLVLAHTVHRVTCSSKSRSNATPRSYSLIRSTSATAV